MTTTNNQKGFAVLEFLIIAVVLGVLVVVGYRVLNKTGNVADTSVNSTVVSVVMPTKITTKAEAKKTAAALDQTPIDSQLNTAQLDSSIKSLL